ncbi:MAG: hypothetical protein EA400_05760 [Chromatiaceae bacterium]|nr:MAG: hypothetical protein EA400_05760 [Chromatiaceae bacterium]
MIHGLLMLLDTNGTQIFVSGHVDITRLGEDLSIFGPGIGRVGTDHDAGLALSAQRLRERMAAGQVPVADDGTGVAAEEDGHSEMSA